MRPVIQYLLLITMAVYLVGSTLMLVKLNARVSDLEHAVGHLMADHKH